MSRTGESSSGSSSDRTIKLFGFELISGGRSPEVTTADSKERLKKKRLQLQARRASIGYYLTSHHQPITTSFQRPYKTPSYCAFSSMHVNNQMGLFNDEWSPISSQISFGNKDMSQDIIEQNGEMGKVYPGVRQNMIQFQRDLTSPSGPKRSIKSLDLHLGIAGDTV
ncbi:hypothetical protein YC2023_097251 [Brassica napus]